MLSMTQSYRLGGLYSRATFRDIFYAMRIKIDLQDAGMPVYRQIYRRTRESILAGLLAPSSKLPSARGLAAELGVARGTIDAAYALLANEGLIEGLGPKGTFVAAQTPRHGSWSTVDRGPKAPAIPTAGLAFHLGVPAFDAFPRKLWAGLVAREARRPPSLHQSLPDPAGFMALRQGLASYLALARGVVCDPQAIFVTAGFQGALGLVVQALARAGDAVLIEEPGYFITRDALLAAGLRVVPVPVDSEGIDIAKAPARAGARLAVVTPSHQSPLAVTMSFRRRLALLDWARRADGLVLEDDYDGEFRYTSAPIPALTSLDPEGRVLYAGTFSKVLLPDLRLGYLVVPEGLVDRFRKVAAGLAPAPSPLLQRVLAEFLHEGHFTRHIRKMRALYGDRRAALAEALAETFGDELGVELSAGGMHLIGRPKGSTSDVELARRAKLAGLGPKELSAFYMSKPEQGLLLSFTNIPAEHALRDARRLHDALVTS